MSSEEQTRATTYRIPLARLGASHGVHLHGWVNPVAKVTITRLSYHLSFSNTLDTTTD
jgi:hypothetical protein